MSAAEAAMVKSVAKHFVDADVAEGGSKKRLSVGSNFSLDPDEAEAVAESFTNVPKSFSHEGKVAEAVADSIALLEAAAEVESSDSGSRANSKAASFAKSTPEKTADIGDADVDDNEYLEVLAHCAELRQQRAQLLRVKAQVRSTIGQFSSFFAADSIETSATSHDDSDDDQDCDLEDADKPPSHEEALAEEQELEEEVETLREALDATSAMVTNLMQKSQEWSDHLDEFENQIQLPAERPLAAPSTPSPQEPAQSAKNGCTNEAKPTRALGGA
jgi:hypothetical protein